MKNYYLCVRIRVPSGESEKSPSVTIARLNWFPYFTHKSVIIWLSRWFTFCIGKYNLSTVVTHKTSDWSVIELDEPVEYIWIKAVRRLDAVEIFYSFDDKDYIMMRNCWLQDNTPVMVGMMAASPDGSGFKVKFDNFRITHLPDQRRCEWLKNNQE